MTGSTLYRSALQAQNLSTQTTEKTFLDHYGPMGLQQAHNDIVDILLLVFQTFSHTKELILPFIVRALSPALATTLWNNILAAQLANMEFVCETTLKLLKVAHSFDG